MDLRRSFGLARLSITWDSGRPASAGRTVRLERRRIDATLLEAKIIDLTAGEGAVTLIVTAHDLRDGDGQRIPRAPDRHGIALVRLEQGDGGERLPDVLVVTLPETILAEQAEAEGLVFLPELLSTGGRHGVAPLARLLTMLVADLDAGMTPDGPLACAYVRALAAFLRASHHGAFLHERRAALGGMTTHSLRRVRLHVAENLSGRVTLDDLAAVAGMSRFHFARAFKQATGQSPLLFVTRQRVERAARLIREGESPITEIALACGFGSSQSFARAFKRLTGLTPREYRMASDRGGAGRAQRHVDSGGAG